MLQHTELYKPQPIILHSDVFSSYGVPIKIYLYGYGNLRIAEWIFI